jgi:hypothetical protein
VHNFVLLQTKGYTNEHQGGTMKNDITLCADNQRLCFRIQNALGFSAEALEKVIAGIKNPTDISRHRLLHPDDRDGLKDALFAYMVFMTENPLSGRNRKINRNLATTIMYGLASSMRCAKATRRSPTPSHPFEMHKRKLTHVSLKF